MVPGDDLGHFLPAAHNGHAGVVKESDNVAAVFTDIKFHREYLLHSWDKVCQTACLRIEKLYVEAGRKSMMGWLRRQKNCGAQRAFRRKFEGKIHEIFILPWPNEVAIGGGISYNN